MEQGLMPTQTVTVNQMIAEADAAEAASATVADAASLAGVNVSVGTVDTAKDPNAVGGSVTVNGVSMSVDSAIGAIGAIADAQSFGLSPSSDPNKPGIDVTGTLSAHAMGEAGVVVGNMSSEIGTPAEVAKAESLHAGRAGAVSNIGTFDTARFGGVTAPTTDINTALSAALADRAQINTRPTTPVAHSTLMNPTPLSQQATTLSTNLTNVNISHTPVAGVTPTQSFNTTNQTIDATSFSLGSFVSEPSTSPSTQSPNSSMSLADQYLQVALGTEIGRLASIKTQLKDRLDQLNPINNYLDVSVMTDTQRAQIAAVEAQIAALDARTNALIDKTVTNQAVAALAEQKAAEVSTLADAVATQEELGQVNTSMKTLASIQTRVDAFDARINTAKANPTTAALTEVINNSKLATLDVDAAFGITPAPTYAAIAPAPSFMESLGLKVGLSPTAANTIARQVDEVVNVVVNSVPGLATLSGVTDYVDTKTLATEIDMPAQAVIDTLTAAGVADPYNQLTQREKNQISNASTLDAQAAVLGRRAIGVAMMDFMGFSAFSPGLRGLSTVDNVAVVGGRFADTPTPTSHSVAPISAIDNTTPTSNVTMSYDYTTNTVTISSPHTTTASVVEGRFSTTGQTAVNDNVPTTPNIATNPTNTTFVGYKSATQNPTSPAVANNNAMTSPASPAATTPAPASLTDNVPTPVSTMDNSAIPGVTRYNDSFSGTAQAMTPSVTPRNVTATAMAVAEMLSSTLSPNPAAISRSFSGVVDTINTAISRTANDISPTTPTTVSVRSANDITPATQAPVANTQAVGTKSASVMPATAVPGATTSDAPTETAVSEVTSPPPSTPVDQTPAIQTQTPSTQVTANPNTPVQAGPASYANIEQSAPTTSKNPVRRALTTVSDGFTTGINELFGIKPAASDPLGVTQNNPTNIRERGSNNDWVGEVKDGVRSFETFIDPEHGFRAAYLIQQSYQEIGVTTVRERIERATPAFENPNQSDYISNVANHMGIDPDTPFDIMDKNKAVAYMEAVTVEEVGTNQFSREQIETGFELARSGSQSLTSTKVTANQPTAVSAPQIVQDVVQIVAATTELSPTIIAVKTAASLLDQLLKPQAQQPNPTTQVNTDVATPPANLTTTNQPTTPATVERVVLKNQNATHRKQPIAITLQDQLDYAAEKNGVTFVVTSGGQATKAEVNSGLAKSTDRTGSSRHDHGNAADGYLQDPITGRVLDFTNPNDLPVFEKFIEDVVKAGATGVGAGVNYMGGSTIHIGGGSPLAWGAKGKVANAPAWLITAHKHGLNAAQNFDLAAYRADQQSVPAQTAVVTPVSGVPASTPTTPPAISQPPSSPMIGVPNIPSASTPTTGLNTPSQVTELTSPNGSISANPQAPVGAGGGTAPSIPGGRTGTPPNNLGNVGPGNTGTPNSLNVVERAGLTVYGAVAAVIAVMASVLG